MRFPYDNGGYGGKKGNGGRSQGYRIDDELSGFDCGSGQMKEADILRQTESMLESHDDTVWAVITRDGRILPKNKAFQEGESSPSELCKTRVWG